MNPHHFDIDTLTFTAKEIRGDILRMLEKAGSGHPGGSLGMADIFTALYFNILNHSPEDPLWEERDRVVLSNGHICPVLYSTLARAGYFDLEELKTLRAFGSRLQGHPNRLDLPGIETSAASLGQGLSISVGMALAARLDDEDHKIYALMSDGELQEGSSWEAANAASKWQLDNLIAIVDRNNIQIDGQTEDIFPIEPVRDKFEAFNWTVLEINGNDMVHILQVIESALEMKGQPVCIIAHTTPGKGVSFMEDKHEWHGIAPNRMELMEGLAELGLEEVAY
ncbi:MAG: transketolase [Candidatus Marinimicrobia bacterium]|nr:transketolase [Candidatus Neomarinimicrobiota bacterium]